MVLGAVARAQALIFNVETLMGFFCLKKDVTPLQQEAIATKMAAS